MQIVTAPHPILSEIAKPVSLKRRTGENSELKAKIDKETAQLIEEMKQTLLIQKDPEGVGLAAPQIGKSIQLFIAMPSLKAGITTYINPKIQLLEESKEQPTALKKSKSKKKSDSVKLEGCLSLPDIWGEVKRSKRISVSYFDEHGIRHTETFSGFLATIIQHEYDHLQGILFPKRVLDQHKKLFKSKKDEKGEIVFEELEI